MDDIKNKLVIAIKEAGKILLAEFRQRTRSRPDAERGTFDYGIAADKKSETVILKAVEKLNLDCQVIAEESGANGNNTSEYTIYVDPLDGTVNFSKKIPTFCTGVAVFQKGKPKLGIVYDPNLEELFVAEAEQGATINGEKIIPSHSVDHPLVNFEWPGAKQYMPIGNKLIQNRIRPRTMGSGILSLLYGTIGRGDGAILLENRPWDVAPGLVFAQALKVPVKTLEGKEVDLGQSYIDLMVAPSPLFSQLGKTLS